MHLRMLVPYEGPQPHGAREKRAMPGMIVAPEPIAVEEGGQVLRDGGNAVDAAVTAALVQEVVSPQMCGIGGYTLLHLYLPRAKTRGFARIHDAPALAGAKVTPDMWVDALIRPNPDGWGYFLKSSVNATGYTAVCTPGAVRGLSEMLEHWGTISWQRAIEPAERVARLGYVVGVDLDNHWRTQAKYLEDYYLLDIIRSNPEAIRIYLYFIAGYTSGGATYGDQMGPVRLDTLSPAPCPS